MFFRIGPLLPNARIGKPKKWCSLDMSGSLHTNGHIFHSVLSNFMYLDTFHELGTLVTGNAMDTPWFSHFLFV